MNTVVNKFELQLVNIGHDNCWSVRQCVILIEQHFLLFFSNMTGLLQCLSSVCQVMMRSTPSLLFFKIVDEHNSLTISKSLDRWNRLLLLRSRFIFCSWSTVFTESLSQKCSNVSKFHQQIRIDVKKSTPFA